MSDGSLITTLSGHASDIISVAISPDGSKIVTGSCDHTAKIWNMSDGSLVRTLSGHADVITSVAISPDGSKVVTGSYDKTAKIWNMSDGSLITTLSGHKSGIISVAISPDGSKVVTGSSDNTARIWNLLPRLFETLKKLTLKQVRLLEWLHELAIKGKKANFTISTPTTYLYKKQYDLLPQLIQDMVKRYVKFE